MNDLHTLQKKLQFKSSHRGSKEMDILLGSFVEKYIKLFNEGELQMLEAILAPIWTNLKNCLKTEHLKDIMDL